LLSLPGATKEVRQFSFDLSDLENDLGGLSYRAGDALSVRPANDAELVEEWLEVTGVEGESLVSIDGVGTIPFHDALRRHLDVAKITQDLLRFLAKQTGDRLLRNLLRPDNKGELAQWCWGRQAADAVAEHPVWADAQEWSDVLGRLQNRRYSISSSPHTDPATLSLTVSVVRYDGSQGRKRKGVCSGFLADAEPGAEVDVYVVPSPRFHPPADPSTPMVMVGPGTGVAPFIGFLHDRAARGHTGANWLFFGEQHQATDYYYREEIEAFQREGTLTRLDTAFSRDQRAKVYVQDRMREHGHRLWQWLESGAHLYVCGDASRMARDVDAALRAIVATHGDVSAEAADTYVKRLTTQKRYVRDVY
jgi:sulfite reductase alpha subunit-like flavoprotein